ncbi:hypothetical protein [Tessaracoccus sp.]
MVYKNTCSQCGETFALNTVTGLVTMRAPSNGRRGSLHVPAHVVTAQGDDDGTLWHWECPLCEYSESEYTDEYEELRT